ncbi:MAG: FliA/WhiG family RNA polymerase sigma factor [Bacteroides sp.]|nr:FliA/WhiG family RNA polymerase sigma factor [Eubacterium sp.]MCM1418404.1 FliA/WhiG family RNA polymerase sigma factor [Roseburia sp.]MCM1461574.1 FliA/WhiG family RNA polymerase sigma factor [Bacteroides sp.]
MKTDFDITAALEKYHETKSVNLRNDIVLNYLELVRVIAVSLRNTYAKYATTDDVVNEGVIALIGAIETYDPERNTKFETYANLKIKGAIIDFVRRQDFVPRQIRHFGRELDASYNELFNKLGRHPTNDELAEYMGITKEKLVRGMAESAGAITLSFEELLYEDNFSLENGDRADKALYDAELKKTIAEAIETLPPKGRQVVTLYYYEKLKFSEIGEVLGVTESRVCQIHSKAMLLLKRRLTEYMNI